MKKNVCRNKIGIIICLLCLLVLVAAPVAFAEGEPEPPAADVGGALPTQADDSNRPSPPPVDSALLDKATQDPQVQPTQGEGMQPQTSQVAPAEANTGNAGKPASGSWVILVLAGILLVLAAGVVYYIVKRKKQ